MLAKYFDEEIVNRRRLPPRDWLGRLTKPNIADRKAGLILQENFDVGGTGTRLAGKVLRL
jgi:hypothetical protein